MTRIDRYGVARLCLSFGVLALVVAVVVWAGRAVTLFDRLIADGQSVLIFLELTALTLPAVMRSAIPVAAFAAAVIVAQRMRGDSETLAMQAAGASALRLARPALVFGLVAAALLSLVVHALVPESRVRIETRTAEVAQDLGARLLTDGAFLHPAPGITFYLAEIDAEGELHGVFLSDARDPRQRVVYTARSAVLSEGPTGPTLVMFDGLAQALEEDGRLFTTRFGEFAYDIGTLVASEGAQDVGLRGMRTSALLGAAGDRAEAWDEFHRRAAQPALTLAIVLLGHAALMLGPFSRMGAWRQVAGAVALVVGLRLLEGALRSATEGAWPLHYAPAALGLLAALALLRRADRPRAVAALPA